MIDHDNFALDMQNKYHCQFTIAAAVVGVAAGVTSIVNSASGGGGGVGIAGGGGGTTMPSFNPGQTIIAAQQPLNEKETPAAKSAYDPNAQAAQWNHIFTNMPTSKETTDMPDVAVPKSNVDTSQDTGGPA